MGTTICGIDTKAFATAPTPAELAAIVARMPTNQMAEFIVLLGEQVRFTCSSPAAQWQHIADSLRRVEATFCDDSGSQLIAELHQRLFDKARAA